MDLSNINPATAVPTPPPEGTNPVAVFTPPKSQKKKIGKSIIIVAVLVLLLAGLVLGFDKARSLLSQATGGCEPEGLSETNITATSVEVVFQTGKTCQVSVNYGISQDGMLLEVPEAMASLNHRIRLSPLLPSTAYYYQVKADGQKFEPVRSFQTTAVANPTPTASPTAIPTSGNPLNYSFEDFSPHFGTANADFDIDKNGVVNSRDWQLYLQSKQ